jgi:exodeoxyribonuclease-5
MKLENLESSVLKHFAYQPTDGQKTLINYLSRFIKSSKKDILFLIKGYAGTGKTTIISSFINVLPEAGIKTVLLAPTGRAAKVLSNYSGKQAFTIHKKIYKIQTTKEGSAFLVLKKNLHKNTIFFIDEASMIPDSKANDNNLFAGRSLLDDLFEFIYTGENCRAVLIGDTAQLPPIGIDISPALDINYLKNSFSLIVGAYELTEVVRQTQQSGILANATNIRHQLSNNNISMPFFNIKGFKDIVSINGAELEDGLNDAYGKYGNENAIVICRSNKMANNFNSEIRKRILFRETELQTGDYMMVVKNNYHWLTDDSEAGFIANGDIIEIQKVKKIEELYDFRFADVTVRLIDYPDEKDLDVKIMLNTLTVETPSLPFAEEKKLFHEIMKDYKDVPLKRNRFKEVKNNPYLNALQVKFAYSLTCHKTQGGQWDIVFINKGYLTKEMLDIEYMRWLYTALTRATKKVYLVNFNEDFFA